MKNGPITMHFGPTITTIQNLCCHQHSIDSQCPKYEPLTATRNVDVTRHVRRLYRGSYMSAHVLLNLLNELGKRDKMRGLPSILSLFCNEFNKFNNTGA